MKISLARLKEIIMEEVARATMEQKDDPRRRDPQEEEVSPQELHMDCRSGVQSACDQLRAMGLLEQSLNIEIVDDE